MHPDGRESYFGSSLFFLSFFVSSDVKIRMGKRGRMRERGRMGENGGERERERENGRVISNPVASELCSGSV
ncbi:hypothetical protein, partial [Microcoleus sp. SVA1_A4]|uniref:hypothetical protein n=1 Tax=Microcoleus sp. SVA1_A4 TaxID=2818948 RepID=UPI002FD4852B